MAEEDRWAKLEEIVRKVVREELSTWNPQKQRSKVQFKNGKFFGLGDIEMAALEAAYPAVEVRKQLNEAAAWILLNPNHAPKSDYGSFINRWLSKHQNQASLRSIPVERPTEVKQKLCGYCPKTATGSANGIWSCDEHTGDALESKPRPRMLGVVAKPVAGRDS